MKKAVWAAFLAVSLIPALFAGGEAETGRGQAMAEVGEGQLLPAGAVDPANYLEDFVFGKSNTSPEPLTFEADLLRESLWEKGEDISLRIALLSNGKDYFRPVSGSYILYFQNPELLGNGEVRGFLEGKLRERGVLEFFLYDPVNASLIGVDDGAGLDASLSRLANQRKRYENNVVLQGLLGAVEERFGGERVHILWATDENIIEKSTDSNFFDFSLNVLGTGNTTFSYLGYGEVPNWSAMNAGLMKHNGNSYYARDEYELCGKIEKDMAFFSTPAVEDITVDIVWSRYVSELAHFYPRSLYPEIADFNPTADNGRPAAGHRIGGMNYGETKRFIHYLRIPPLQRLRESTENREPRSGNRFKAGTVYVSYYVPMEGRRFYGQKDLFVSYGDASEVTGGQDPSVFCDTIIQNTPLVILEIANLVNRYRNYLAAIQLVKSQKNLLQKVNLLRPDPAVDEDLALLDDYYQLLFDQARTMNLLE